jgi:nitrogen-specific signal transduction histidine kinase
MKNNGAGKQSDSSIALHYIKTFSDTAREPFLILNADLRVVGANKSFYKNFRVSKEQTGNRHIYELGNGQWNIPELRTLLERILPKKFIFNDFEVTHRFPKIGLKIMLLNARRLDTTGLILLAIEDITLKRAVETRLANYTKNLEKGINERTSELKIRVDELIRLNKLMIGRELKMVELKKEIFGLKKIKKYERGKKTNNRAR